MNRRPSGDLFLGPTIVGLSARAAQDFLAEHERLGKLVAREALGRFVEQRLFAGIAAPAQRNNRHDLLAPPLAWSSADHDIVDGGMVLERLLDFFCENFLAARIDR